MLTTKYTDRGEKKIDSIPSAMIRKSKYVRMQMLATPAQLLWDTSMIEKSNFVSGNGSKSEKKNLSS